MRNLSFSIVGAALFLASAAYAESWYLMAPDEKIISEPRAAMRMEHGTVFGPVEFIAREKFASRAECEPRRQQLIGKWWRLSVIKRGNWDQHRFTTPSVFVRCISASDPQLKQRGGPDVAPSLETFINRPQRR
jgi:hypothetical protein